MKTKKQDYNEFRYNDNLNTSVQGGRPRFNAGD